jgi:hypothetical protein
MLTVIRASRSCGGAGGGGGMADAVEALNKSGIADQSLRDNLRIIAVSVPPPNDPSIFTTNVEGICEPIGLLLPEDCLSGAAAADT